MKKTTKIALGLTVATAATAATAYGACHLIDELLNNKSVII